jgi:hypothetical protein
MIGSELGERFGLSFKHDEVIKHMIEKWNWDGELYFNRTYLKDFYNGMEYEDNGFKVMWDHPDIIDSLRVLDSIPFENIKIIRTTKAFPLILQRENIAVYIAPRMWKIVGNGEIKLPQQDYSKFDKIRDSRVFTKEVEQLMGNWFLENRYCDGKLWDSNIMCSNCGVYLHPSDWYNSVHNNNHPDCSCICDCERCIRIREVKAYFERVKEENELSYQRKKLKSKN